MKFMLLRLIDRIQEEASDLVNKCDDCLQFSTATKLF